MLIEILSVFIATALSSLITAWLTRKKYKSEAKNQDLLNVQKVIEIYSDGLEELKLELKLAKNEIDILRNKMLVLTKQNYKLESDLKVLQKQQKQRA